MEFIHRGWALIADGDNILFHDSGEREELQEYYIYDGTLKKLNEQEYFQKKYGKASEKIMNIYGTKMTDSLHDLDGNIYINFYQDGYFKKFDSIGNLIRVYEDNFDTIYDIEVQEKTIWVAYPTANIIKRYNLDSFNEEFSLGDRMDESILCLPESLMIYDNHLYICDTGNNRIRKLNLTNLNIDEYMTFDEPVWEYVRTQNKEYVRLQSGIYSVKTSIA
ncbi:hypothetical protein [Paenibacillus dakarensis]|uniref:hypothetical protein n=1 Tax=Paenibacillus dakarensis TaxID=1527293 RepID=UPI0006D5A492|nr:hypothetical protein [Paenibacillus dakarensis]